MSGVQLLLNIKMAHTMGAQLLLSVFLLPLWLLIFYGPHFIVCLSGYCALCGRASCRALLRVLQHYTIHAHTVGCGLCDTGTNPVCPTTCVGYVWAANADSVLVSGEACGMCERCSHTMAHTAAVPLHAGCLMATPSRRDTTVCVTHLFAATRCHAGLPTQVSVVAFISILRIDV